MVNIKLKQKNKLIKKGMIMVCMVMLLFSGCTVKSESENDSAEEPQDNIINGSEQIDSMSVIDNPAIYSMDDPSSISYFYVTVRYGSEADGTNHTFNEVNNAVRFADDAHVNTEVYARALLQAGDENGPAAGMLGFGETQNNAVIRLRGSSSSLHPQKSYKIKLNDNAGLWRGQSNIALNKHGYDVTRFRNKLYFDTLREIDAVPSIRTQFSILYVKDETSGETAFKNYGIFTQAEVPTKKYLSNHGMDSNGYLYKAINFNFEPDDAIKNFDDKAFDLEAMDNVISCRGREDNEKLINLINMINDTSVDIDYIIDNYFDRDNYEYWLAYNILMGNIDTTMQNFYLYSPLNGNKWYFIPWDGDASLMNHQWALTDSDKAKGEWECGITNYWGVILHQRYLKYETNRKRLEEKVDELHSWLNKEYIDTKAQEYNEAIEEYVLSMPDLLYLGYTPEERDYVVSTLGDELEDNYVKFKNSLTSLMPFFIYEPADNGSTVSFEWENSFDFNAGKITYDITISRFPDMSSPAVELKDVEGTIYDIEKNLFEDGYYYVKIVAKASDGRTMGAFNKTVAGDETYCGVYEFYIDAD